MLVQDKVRLRDGYVKFMNSLDVIRMVTVTFRYKFSDKICLDKLNTGLHYVNSYLYGNSYKKHKVKFMEGVVVLERHLSGMPHYHILITRDTGLSRTDEDVVKLIQRGFSKVTHTSGNKVYKAFSDVGIDIRDAETDSGKLARYLTKEGYDTDFDNIGLLSDNRVTFDFL